MGNEQLILAQADDLETNLMTNADMMFTYSYDQCDSIEFYCFTATIQNINTSLDQTLTLRAVAHDTDEVTKIMSNEFKYHCFVIQNRFEIDSSAAAYTYINL